MESFQASGPFPTTAMARDNGGLVPSRALYCDTMPAMGTVKKRRTGATKVGIGSQKDLAGVFAALRALLSPYEDELAVQTDKPGSYCLQSRTPTYRNRPMYFAGVRLGKNYVSYYLMSVYACQKLLKAMSPELKKRMQGKACFNFSAVDPMLFAELATLTRAGYERFKSMKYL